MNKKQGVLTTAQKGFTSLELIIIMAVISNLTAAPSAAYQKYPTKWQSVKTQSPSALPARMPGSPPPPPPPN